MELKLYRHNMYKDVYLKRNTGMCGGGENTQFYCATKSPTEAIESLSYHGDEFLTWYHHFKNNWVRYVLTKDMEFDGYKGVLSKEEKLYIRDFELVTLVEKLDETQFDDMKYDEKLAEKLCREMGMEFHPEQEGVTIGGKKLPDNFSTAKLFRGEYDDSDKT